MQNKKIFLLIMLLTISLIAAADIAEARTGHIKLLSVSEGKGNATIFKGGTADVYLEIQPGNGRVFIDTFPISNLDTQISTRFAKDISCDFINRDCSTVDFFYTIRSNTVSIGGPSGSASIAVLTIAVLKNLDIDESAVMTGTINSGGIIGPVGGVREKIIAAESEGLNTVLIPFGTEHYNKGNETIDLVEMGKDLNVTVVPVKTVNEALFHFTGEEYDISADEVLRSQTYEDTMENISSSICKNTFSYQQEYENNIGSGNLSNESIQMINATSEMINQSRTYLESQKYYSAASGCFGANIRFRYMDMMQQNLTDEDVADRLDDISSEIFAKELEVENWELDTVSDLQAYMVVSERLKEGSNHMENAREFLVENDTASAIYQLAYGQERYISALEWSKFYGKEGEKLEINEEKLADGCIKKINEASERVEYLNFFAPIPLDTIESQLRDARIKYQLGDHALCIFTASKAKAEADVIISAISSSENRTKEIIQTKLDLAKNIILDEQDSGNFPFLGYSYYEYADLLKDTDPNSAMLYSQYALELSEISHYFGEPRIPFIIIDKEISYGFILGSLFGGLLAIILIKKQKMRKKSRNKKRKRSIKEY